MLEILKEYYNINIKNYKQYNDGIIFYFKRTYFYFTKSLLDEKQVIKMFELSQKLKKQRINFHDCIFNKEKKLLSNGYVLLKINTPIDQITFFDLVQYNKIKLEINIDNYLFVDEIWERKIDIFAKKVAEETKNKLIHYSYDYFSGIAEILIRFFNKNYNKNQNRLSLSHQSMYLLDSIEFYNPLNIKIDHYLKDYASFLRINSDSERFNKIISQINSNDKVYLFFRMTFPFQYFKEVENIIDKGKGESELIKIINNVQKYENYLLEMERKFKIYIFYWIKKAIKVQH